MGSFVFWPANHNHPIWRSLSLNAKGLFMEMAGLMADGEREDLPHGIWLSIWLPFLNATPKQIDAGLLELEQKGVIQRIDDPEGWLVLNWTERVEAVRPTSLEAQQIKWGQKTAEYYFSRRKKDAQRKRDQRAATANSQMD